MSVKTELHELVDQLDDQEATEALEVLRRLRKPASESWPVPLEERMGPLIMSGREFFLRPSKDLATIAAEQGVKPIKSIDELRGDFWPEKESIDEFVETIRRWRREGGYA